MSSTPKDIELYTYVKKLANKKFKSPTGVYKSSWIVKKYKELGGKYKSSSSKSPKLSGLKRWYKEKWVDINRPMGNRGDYKPCGRSSIKKNSKYPLCRPSVRVNKETPRTLKEISKKSIKKAQKEKKSPSRIQFGKGDVRAQYYGKKSKVMVKVPQEVKRVALYSFKLKEMGFGGGLKTGWLRAKQLATKSEIPIEDLKFMRNWFARHIYASYPSYRKWIAAGKPNEPYWHNKHGIISWLIWGGTPAFKWVNSQKNINLLNEYYNKDYTKITKQI